MLSAAQEAVQTSQAALAEVRRRSDSLAELLERERTLSKEMQAKAETAIADAARLAGKLEVLQAQNNLGR